MNIYKQKFLFLTGLVLITLSFNANSAPIVLDFEGIGNNAQILEFYNGGTDSAGNSGPNYGVSFNDTALAIIDSDAGGGGNTANEPSPETVLFWLSTESAILNYAAGFETGFSFFYSASTAFPDGSVDVWDGVNATGNLLGTINLPGNFQDGGCSGDPNGAYCNWDAAFLGFAGIARSIDFNGAANYIAFDNVTFGSITPGGSVPEPGAIGLLALGLLGLGLTRKRGIS